MSERVSPSFTGFPDDPHGFVPLPVTFFTQVLNQIETIEELRLLLYIFWHAEQQQDQVHYFRREDLFSDSVLLKMVGNEEGLTQALLGLITQGLVIQATIDWMAETYYFLNTSQGRAAAQAIAAGEWKVEQQDRQPIHLPAQAPNIFQLYEENIGVITPMMAEILKEDEKTYPAHWIGEAIKIAVNRNVRTWNYVQAILKRWHKEGYNNEQNRKFDSQDPERYRKSWLKQE
jgi:DnaD/phage-associated family protein